MAAPTMPSVLVTQDGVVYTRGEHIRIEHWTNAAEQGAAAARNMVGEPAPYAAVPYFWSDQYDVRIQFYGHSGPDAETIVLDGGTTGMRFTVIYRERGIITGVLGWNAPRETRDLRAALGTPGRTDAMRLA